MLGYLAKGLLVGTSLAPILITWAYADYLNAGFQGRQVAFLVATLGCVILCALILGEARKRLPRSSIEVVSVRPADTEVVGFVIAYLFPLAFATADTLDTRLLVFVVLLIAFIVWTTNAFNFNPLMTALRYHFYEVEAANRVTYLVLSKSDIVRTRDVSRVAQLTNYVLLDVSSNPPST